MQAQTSTKTRCMKLTTPSLLIQPKSGETVQIGASPLHDFSEYGQAIKIKTERFTLLALHLLLHLNQHAEYGNSLGDLKIKTPTFIANLLRENRNVRFLLFKPSLRSTAKYARLFE